MQRLAALLAELQKLEVIPAEQNTVILLDLLQGYGSSPEERLFKRQLLLRLFVVLDGGLFGGLRSDGVAGNDVLQHLETILGEIFGGKFIET